MSLAEAGATARPQSGRARRGGLLAGGTDGNELLTSATGALLVVLLAVIGVTILRIGQLLWLHMFIGLLLVGPIALKLLSTGYRFTRYYTGASAYRAKGPPWTPLRLIAPIVVLTTLLVMVSGIALLFAGPGSRSTLLPIHKVSFIAWIAFTALHVLAHLPEMGRGLREDYGDRLTATVRVPGRGGRLFALASAMVLGLVIALVLVPEFAPWMHAHLHHLNQH